MTSTRYPHLKEKLTEILDKANRYDIDAEARQNLVTVVEALIYIIDHIDRLKEAQRGLYFLQTTKGAVPIHLENYPAGDPGEKLMMGSLVEFFLDSFDNIQSTPSQLKEFCSRLNGYCIDARTRSAFDYVKELDYKYTLQAMVLYSKKQLALRNNGSYFWVLGSMQKHFWGQAIKEDKNFPAIKGTLNSDNYQHIQGFLKDILVLTPSTDFCRAYKTVPTHLRESYYTMFLKETDLIKALDFSGQSQHLREDYDDMILGEGEGQDQKADGAFATIFNKSKADFSIRLKLYSLLSDHALVELWSNTDFSEKSWGNWKEYTQFFNLLFEASKKLNFDILDIMEKKHFEFMLRANDGGHKSSFFSAFIALLLESLNLHHCEKKTHDSKATLDKKTDSAEEPESLIKLVNILKAQPVNNEEIDFNCVANALKKQLEKRHYFEIITEYFTQFLKAFYSKKNVISFKELIEYSCFDNETLAHLTTNANLMKKCFMYLNNKQYQIFLNQLAKKGINLEFLPNLKFFSHCLSERNRDSFICYYFNTLKKMKLTIDSVNLLIKDECQINVSAIYGNLDLLFSIYNWVSYYYPDDKKSLKWFVDHYLEVLLLDSSGIEIASEVINDCVIYNQISKSEIMSYVSSNHKLLDQKSIRHIATTMNINDISDIVASSYKLFTDLFLKIPTQEKQFELVCHLFNKLSEKQLTTLISQNNLYALKPAFLDMLRYKITTPTSTQTMTSYLLDYLGYTRNPLRFTHAVKAVLVINNTSCTVKEKRESITTFSDETKKNHEQVKICCYTRSRLARIFDREMSGTEFTQNGYGFYSYKHSQDEMKKTPDQDTREHKSTPEA